MTQIIPRFEDISFSTSKNVYKKTESKDSTKLFEVKKQGTVIAFFHAILNKLFGSKTITQSNIEVVTSSAINNIDNMKLTTENLIDARNITNKMQEISPDSKTIKKLQQKIDIKIVLLYKKEFYDALPKAYTSQAIASQIQLDIPRALDCVYNQKPLIDQTNYKKNFFNIPLETKAVVLANCQFFEPQRNAVAYGFDLNYFKPNGDKIEVKLKREYSIKKSDKDHITVSVKTSWELPDRNLISVNHDIQFDVAKINDIFDNPNDANKEGYPVTNIDIKKINISDPKILDRIIEPIN